MSIHQRLGVIQRTLKAPKNQFNSFGKYNYRSCEDICEGIKPILIDGETVTLSDKVVLIGTRYYVEATATFSDGTDSISITAYAREEEDKKGMDGSQITGTASSYARKYALNGLFLIDDTKDADANENGGDKDKKKDPPKEPKKEPPKSEGNVVEFIPEVVNSKAGEKADGTKYNKYGIKDTSGNWYGTFSDTFGEIAKKAHVECNKVKVTYKEGKYGREVVTLELVEAA